MTSPLAKAIELVNAGQRDEARKIYEEASEVLGRKFDYPSD